MDRRQLLVGAVALAALTDSALAADKKMKHHAMPHQDLLMAANDCVIKGQQCLAHGLMMLADGHSDMAACAKSVNQMLVFAESLQKLATQQSSYLPAQAWLAQKVFQDCETECRKHKEHQECLACADACQVCYQQCQQLAIK